MSGGYNMEAFGVRFAVSDQQRFEMLRTIFDEAKKDQDAGAFRGAKAWATLVPDDVKPQFIWITDEQREMWVTIRNSVVTAVPEVADQLGGVWVFDRVFETIEESEYTLVSCEMVSEGEAEMRIDPHSYPYGGVGPFIALAEAFGFWVLGVNEYGKYQSRAALLGER